MTPFSVLLRDICRSRQLRQKQLAYELGIDPSYLSALVAGRKGRPNGAIVQKMQRVLNLTAEEAESLQTAANFSRIRYRMPIGAEPQEHVIVSKIFDAVGRLKPAQIDIIDAALKL